MSLIDVSHLAPARIVDIIDRAAAMRQGSPGGRYAGRTVVPMFFEPSTRTKISFDLAAIRLGAHVVGFDHATSSASKGETLRDTARTIGAMEPDLLVVRHRSAGAPDAVARWSGRPVVNAGDGRRAHPTQTLADLLTIRDHFGRIDGLHLGVVGDVVNSRVARGLLYSFPALGGRVTAIGPTTFLPDHGRWVMEVAGDLDDVIGELDIVYLLRVQKERGGGLGYPSDPEYHRRFGLHDDRASKMKPDTVIMHPGPVNRGVEVADEVADSARSLILSQVAAGIPVRMAVMAMIFEGEL